MATPAERIKAAQDRANAALNLLSDRPGMDITARLNAVALQNTAVCNILLSNNLLLGLLQVTQNQAMAAVATECEALATALENM